MAPIDLNQAESNLMETTHIGIKDTTIVFTVPFDWKEQQKESLSNLLFEEINFIKTILFLPQEICALWASGRDSGLVVDIGHSGTRLVALHKDDVIKGVRLDNFGGKRLTECFIKLYDAKSYFRHNTSFYCLDQVKCNLCYLSSDFKKDMEMCLKDSASYRKTWHFCNIPHTHYFSSELFFVPEALFQPKMILMSIEGIPDQVIKLISDCPEDIKIKMYNNIIVSGGSSQFTGLSQRITKGVLVKSKDLHIIRDLLLELHHISSSRFSLLSKDTLNKIADLVGPVEVNVFTPDMMFFEGRNGGLLTLKGAERAIDSKTLWNYKHLTSYNRKT